MLIFAVIVFPHCNEDFGDRESQRTGIFSGVQLRSEGLSEEEEAALRAHIEEVLAFREAVQQWRSGATGEPMEAEEVIRKTEIVFNYLQGNIADFFEYYQNFEFEIAVPPAATWTTVQVVAFYDEVKANLLGIVNESSTFLHVLALSHPYDTAGEKRVYMFAQIGVNRLAAPNDTIALGEEGVRWTKAPTGHTPITPCSDQPSAADDIIGSRANALLNVYRSINLPPTGGNTPVYPKVVSELVYGVHSYYGWRPDERLLEIYAIKTRGTPLQAFHYNDEAYAPAVPDWNCLSEAETRALTLGNLELMRNGQRFVPPIKIKGEFFERKGVCTYVTGYEEKEQQSGLRYQEHTTRHYFGGVGYIRPDTTTPVPHSRQVNPLEQEEGCFLLLLSFS